VGTLKYLYFLFIPVLCIPCQGQELREIPWDAKHNLSWTDFKGRPFATAWAAATTASGISYEYTGEERADGYELHFKVGAFFYPDKSWYRPELCDESVLQHEQLHFDISELYARKLKKELESTRFSKNVKKEVQAIYDRILVELSALQSRYDHETNYSRDTRKQLFWVQKIHQALQETPVVP